MRSSATHSKPNKLHHSVVYFCMRDINHQTTRMAIDTPTSTIFNRSSGPFMPTASSMISPIDCSGVDGSDIVLGCDDREIK